MSDRWSWLANKRARWLVAIVAVVLLILAWFAVRAGASFSILGIFDFDASSKVLAECQQRAAVAEANEAAADARAAAANQTLLLVSNACGS